MLTVQIEFRFTSCSAIYQLCYISLQTCFLNYVTEKMLLSEKSVVKIT